jgi:hypothetical protein
MVGFLVSAVFLYGCASQPKGPSAYSIASAGITACNQQSLVSKVAYARCRQVAMNTAYSGTFWAPSINWLSSEDVALAEQVDMGKLTDAQAQAQLSADAMQVNQQMMAQMNQMAAGQAAMERPLFDAIARGPQQKP